MLLNPTLHGLRMFDKNKKSVKAKCEGGRGMRVMDGVTYNLCSTLIVQLFITMFCFQVSLPHVHPDPPDLTSTGM